MTKECDFCYKDIDISATQCPHCGIIFENINIPDMILTDCATNLQIIINSEVISNKPNATITLGRESDICSDFFKDFEKISRKHCLVTLDNTEYKIEHLPTATNPTKINNRNLIPGLKSIIHDGATLTLADKDFHVSIVSPATNEPPAEQAVVEYKLVIRCPKCGTDYPVEDENAQITECANCQVYNKNKISKVKPQKLPKNAN